MQGWFQKNKNRILLYAGQGGLAAVTGAAFFAAGFSPLLPFITIGAVLAARRFLPGQGRREALMLAAYDEKYTRLLPGNSLHDRVARVAARTGVEVPHIFLVPARLAEIDVMSIRMQSRDTAQPGILLLPASLFAATYPGRLPVFTPAEQEAVLAHELAHIKNNDSLRGMAHDAARRMTTLAYVFAGIGAMLGAVPLTALTACAFLFPAALLLDRFCSRRIEYITDAAAVACTKDPRALATALEKLHKTMVHMNAFAANARDIAVAEGLSDSVVVFRGRPAPPGAEDDADESPAQRAFLALFSTHPGRAARYSHLRAQAAALGLPPLPPARPPVDMGDLLRRTDDGIILPPFAVPSTVQHNPRTGEVSVVTASAAFNRAAGLPPAAPVPPRRGLFPPPRP